MVHCVEPNPRRKALVKPELIPPVHGDQVAEPLVSKLVCYDVDNAIAVLLIRGIFVEQDGGCAIGDQSPVLHCAVCLDDSGQRLALRQGTHRCKIQM